MRSVAVALALALACTFETTPDPLALDERIWISPRFSAAETEAILDAIDEWHQATGGAVDLRPEIGYGKPAIVPAELPGNMIGAWNRKTRNVYLEVARPIVILHEIGHGLGLEHREGTLMSPVVHDRECIDTVTLHVFAESRGLDPAYMLTTCPTEIN